MYSIDVSGVLQTHFQIEDILIYAGTILIGFELLRKINRFELMLTLIVVWPLSPLINAFPTTQAQRARFKWRLIFKKFSLVKLFYTILLLPLLLPLSLVSLLAYIFTELVNSIEKLLNIVWKRLITRFEKASRKFAGILIQRTKRYHGLSARAVVAKMKEQTIPFLPIIGIILILISLFIRIF